MHFIIYALEIVGLVVALFCLALYKIMQYESMDKNSEEWLMLCALYDVDNDWGV